MVCQFGVKRQKKHRSYCAFYQTGFRDAVRYSDNLLPKKPSLQQLQTLHHNGNLLYVNVFVCLGMHWCRVHPHHKRLGTAFFHHMCIMINPLGMGLRCSLASSLEIICINPHRRRYGVVIPSNPQRRGESKICYVAFNGLWVYYIYQLI
jgi:hypothetical protein